MSISVNLLLTEFSG